MEAFGDETPGVEVGGNGAGDEDEGSRRVEAEQRRLEVRWWGWAGRVGARQTRDTDVPRCVDAFAPCARTGCAASVAVGGDVQFRGWEEARVRIQGLWWAWELGCGDSG